MTSCFTGAFTCKYLQEIMKRCCSNAEMLFRVRDNSILTIKKSLQINGQHFELLIK